MLSFKRFLCPMTSAGSGSSSAPPATALEKGAFAPVPPAERIATLDILRGFALLGVLWSNLNDSYGAPEAWRMPHFPITLEHSLAWVQQWMIQDRFYSLLAFLFGVGFGIQLRRAEAVGGNARIMFSRRMLALLAFGLIHGTLIWHGDILTSYALVGFVLVLFSGFLPRRLLFAAAATFFLLPYAERLIATALSLTPGAAEPPDIARIYASGTYAQIATLRVHQYVAWYTRWAVMGWVWNGLTLFVLGLWAERIGLASNLCGHISRIRRALWIALGCAAAGFLILNSLGRWWPRPAVPVTSWLDPRFWSIRTVVQDDARRLFYWGIAAAYAAALTLLLQRPGWAKRLAPLAAVGRMTLTTYLMQSIICTILFYSYGFGWYGRFGLTGMFVITMIVFAFQMAASTYWLRRFRFGPAEWLWRSLSYGRAQPMRLASHPLSAAASGQ